MASNNTVKNVLNGSFATSCSSPITIKVATWNILAIDKSQMSAAGMYAFGWTDDPSKETFTTTKVAWLKTQLSVLKTNGVDLIGLQEVDAASVPALDEMRSDYEVVEGPQTTSGNMEDSSYLLYRKETFQPFKETGKTQDYLFGEMTLKDGPYIGRTFSIATGHSASSGLPKSGDAKTIVAAKPLILFGDHNAPNSEVETELKRVDPRMKTDMYPKGEDTMKKSQYKFRKLCQALSNTKGWAGWESLGLGCAKNCVSFDDWMASKGFDKLAEKELLAKIQLAEDKGGLGFGKKTDEFNAAKYGFRWCRGSAKDLNPFKDVFSNPAMDFLPPSVNNEALPQHMYPIMKVFPLDKIWELIFCTSGTCDAINNAKAAEVLQDKVTELSKDDVGEEDGIFVFDTSASSASHVTIADTDLIGPDLLGGGAAPNDAWMSDHFLLKATVSICGEALGTSTASEGVEAEE